MFRALTYRTGWIYVVALTAVPVLIWFYAYGLDQFATAFGFWKALGKLAGLVALVLYALNFVLSTRLPLFDELFGGLNRAYTAHHIIGGVALMAMLAHPLLMAFGYMAGGLARDGMRMLLPSIGASVDWPLNLGFASLAVTFGLLYITFFMKLRYEAWFKTHQVLGVAFLLAGLHAYLIPSDLTTLPSLRAYMLVIIGLGLVAYGYRTVFGQLLVRRRKMVVAAVTPVSKRSIRISLMPRSPLDRLAFMPGQFVFVRFRQPGIPDQVHPFSVTSGMGSQQVDLIIKTLGDYTGRLWQLRPGAMAEVEGAFGRFYAHAPPNRPQVWVAGGIGITPFLSMAKSLPAQSGVELFYVVEDANDLVEYNELMQIVSQMPGRLSLQIYMSRQQGRITAGYIAQHSMNGLAGKHILLCGPPPMMASLRRQFQQGGISDNRIHSEEFMLS